MTNKKKKKEGAFRVIGTKLASSLCVCIHTSKRTRLAATYGDFSVGAELTPGIVIYLLLLLLLLVARVNGGTINMILRIMKFVAKAAKS